MKQMQKILSLLAAAALLFAASCSDDETAAYLATGVTLNETALTIEIGQVELLIAQVEPKNLVDKTVVWRSSNNKVAAVGEKGDVMGVSPGTTTITALTLNGKKATCAITVTDVQPSGVTLNKTSASLLVGATEQLTATVQPADAVPKVTWESSNTDVATVSETGAVTAVAVGAATVTATTSNGLTAACAVSVTTLTATGVQLNTTTLDVPVGGKATLIATVLPFPGAAQNVTWSSDNTSIVTVDETTGEITAVASTGTANVTATVVENTGYKASCAVTVVPSIKLTLTGYTGTAATLTYTDNTSDKLTLTNSSAFMLASQKTIKAITLEGGDPILIGRKADSNISLKIIGATPALRDAVSGAVPIGSYAEFQLIRGDALTGSYKQEADLDLMSELWTRIGTTTEKFSGTFDGAGYTLANINVNNTSSAGADEGQGLFGQITDATIKNVHLISGNVRSLASCTGGICGWSKSATFIGCSNNAAISGANNSTAGISGYGCSLFIACRNSGAITTSGQYAGGIVAYYFDNGSVTGIVACYNTGAISATGAASYNIGGIAGQAQGSKGILACYNTGAVTFTTSSAATIGGIAGTNSNIMQGCYWSSNNASAAGAGSGAVTNTQKFGASAWPSTTIHAQWGTGDGSGDNKYWKALGSWNGGNPTYPTLFFE
jgi:uncharacterized protein YjdB